MEFEHPTDRGQRLPSRWCCSRPDEDVSLICLQAGILRVAHPQAGDQFPQTTFPFRPIQQLTHLISQVRWRDHIIQPDIELHADTQSERRVVERFENGLMELLVLFAG